MGQIRPLVAADGAASWRLSAEAFGSAPGDTAPPDDSFLGPGRHHWGSFEGKRLLAKTVGCEFASWWRGAHVATWGIAGVAIAAEARGTGLLAPLMAATLEQGRAAGATVSTLYPTAPGIYRGLGYELVGSLDTVELPTSAAALVRAPSGVTLRRAELADIAAVRRVREAWAASHHGPLSWTGPSFPATDDQLLARQAEITLAEIDDEVVGFAEWVRGVGYDATGVIDVPSLVTLDPRALAALWRMLGSFASVSGRIRLHTSAGDPARWALPTDHWSIASSHPYMLRVLDVVGAFTGLPCAPSVHVPFTVSGDRLGVLDGSYLLTAVDGRTVCASAAASDGPVLDPRGLALAWSGTASCGQLRLAGLLTGPASYDVELDALLAGPPLQLRTYF